MRKEKNNNGFTLIELIVAMAILAILMTAVCSLMGIGIFNYRKVKADVSLQTSAQDTFTRLSDSIMQSNTIVIEGWTSSNPISFSKSGADSSETVTLHYYVLNDDVKNDFIANPAKYGIVSRFGTISAGNVLLFSDLNPSDEIYATAIGIRRAANLDLSLVSSKAGSGKIKALDRFSATNEMVEVTDASGNVNEKDTVVDYFAFDNENLYYGTSYRFMDQADDTVDLSNETSKSIHMYTNQLSYVNVASGGGTVGITGIKLKVDANTGSVDINMAFNDKNATFTSDGKASPRNSYVIKARKVSGSAAGAGGTSSEETSSESSENASSEATEGE